MVSRGLFYFVTAILFLAGILLIGYQRVTFDIPFVPSDERQIWTVEARVEFEPKDNAATEVVLALPAVQPGFTQLEQTTASLGYGVNYVKKDGSNFVEWTKRNPQGLQIVYYRADILVDKSATASSMIVPALVQSTEPEPYATAMAEIARIATSRSSGPYSFATQVIHELNQESELTSLLFSKYKRSDLLTNILQVGKVHARTVGVLDLKDGRRNQKLHNYVAVFNGSEYKIFNPSTGKTGLEQNQMIWNDNGNSLLDISGGHNALVRFTTINHPVSAVEAGERKANIDIAAGEELVPFSLSALPLDEQSLFKGLLLLPIGVVIVVFLRVIVGIKTSGTFMPVLIAMSFLETSLWFGLIGFVSIVGVGLIVRSWLSRLNLLLVARISAVIITVIGLIGFISFFTFKIGLTEGVKITFFPMIILSWTIERMSILWEEEGYKEVLKQGGGSLFVAVVAYLSMSSVFIQHFTYNFLGLQLILLSLVLIMGNYTGFRLSELKRFKPLATQINLYQNGDEKVHESERLKDELNALKSDPHNVYRKWKNEAQESIDNSKDHQ
ncbi:MAG: inactive transglutaminase family protein [Succinivibrio sp.]|nr:inactive transglutaminase family protein [Succinivibrio sp.]MCI7772779.1 inactive transglutaminase family protein [Succinivibrio sp.]MCI7785456.1 inactive transglutaminase family protein [Succinivibrio sp.]MDY5187879.1 inactive transglutaminase family protein [Succinivibrio sp.]MDY5904821.1 inactive transglutaminase family protein [Succinivibrio sp.]